MIIDKELRSSLGASFFAFVLIVLWSLPNAAVAERGPEMDPNCPPTIGKSDLPVEWTYHNATLPSMFFRNPPADGYYLGFNDQGSLIESQTDRKIYQWNITTGSLKVVYPNIAAIPLGVAEALRNPNTKINDIIEESKPAKPAPAPPKANNHPVDPARAALFSNPDAVRAGIGGALSQQSGPAPVGAHTVGSSSNAGGAITGVGAKVSGGVLTFTAKDGSVHSYKVVRPSNLTMPPGVIAGSWFAVDDGMMFNVQPDTEVMGSKLPDAVYQAMKQAVH